MHSAPFGCIKSGLVDCFPGHGEKGRIPDLGRCERGSARRPRNSRRAAISCITRSRFAPNRASSTVWRDLQLGRRPRSSRWDTPLRNSQLGRQPRSSRWNITLLEHMHWVPSLPQPQPAPETRTTAAFRSAAAISIWNPDDSRVPFILRRHCTISICTVQYRTW